MYRIEDATMKHNVYSAFTKKTREFRQRLSFGEGYGENFLKQISFEEGITKIEISQEGNSDGNGLVFGSCCASSCSVEFYNPDRTYNYTDKTVFIECGIKIADGSFFYIPCGYYKAEKPETDDDWRTVKITAYDAIDKMTESWNTGVSFPSNAYALLEDVVKKHNLEIDIDMYVRNELRDRTITQAEAEILTAYNEREVCGFLVGLVAANARINTVGKFSVSRYQYFPAEEFTIIPEVQWQNGFVKNAEEEFLISSVTSGVDDNVFTAGTGQGISFVNPIVTESEIYNLYDMYSGLSFQPSSCEWRGNPCVECGDTVYVKDKNGNIYTVFVASQEIDLTGGLSMTTHCPGGDAEISFDTVDERTRKALNKQYTALQQAIVDASNAINGALGGHYEVLDSDKDGNPDGWLIKQYQDGTGGLIRANYAGIGLSTDGGKTYRTAITYKGINADCITTGKLKADLIDTSTLVVGGGSYENLEGLLNGVVDTANNSITKVDVLYGKNQSTTTPPTSWSTDAPVWQNGYYIWTKTQTIAGGRPTETDPVCITGAKGPTGATGETGSNGLGISKIEEQYYLSTSSTSVTGGSWSTNQPEWSKNKYIWTRSKVTWDNNSVTYTTAVLAKAINGANESANASKLILDAVTAQENNVTVIKGSSIATGSIGAVQIASESITADKLSVGVGELVNQFYNGDFSESANSVPGWEGYNSAITKNTNYVEVAYTEKNLLTNNDSEFVSIENWQVKNCTKVQPYQDVDMIRIAPSSLSVAADMYTPVKLENGNRYSISAQVNFYEWNSSSSAQSFGLYIDGSRIYYTSQKWDPVKGEQNIEFVFDYTGETKVVNLGFWFRGIKNSAGSPAKINFAWAAVAKANLQASSSFYSTCSSWLSTEENLINKGVYISTAKAYLTYIATTVNEKLQLFYQKKRLVENKRYVLLTRLRVHNLNTVSNGLLAVWGQNSSGTAHTPSGISLNGKNESDSFVVMKFVFDYTGTTGMNDVGLCWKGLLDDGGQPCKIRVDWIQLYQDDTAELGFYCSDDSWLADNYKESNLISDSSEINAYNRKPALVVQDDDLYFFGKVQSALGNIGFLKYTTEEMVAETSSQFYADSSVSELNQQYTFDSSFKIQKPNGILDANGLGLYTNQNGVHLLSVYEYSSMRHMYDISDGYTWYKSIVSATGLNARSESGSVVYGANGIMINGDTILKREDLIALKKLVE